MSDNSVIEVNDDVEIEVDKIDADFDKIDVDKIDADFDKIDVDKNDVDKIDFDKINVDENDVDKIFTFDDEPHNGNPITMIEISLNEKYLITYSEEDRSIVGWNVDKIQLKFHQTVKTNEDYKNKKYEIKSLCVSDDKKLAYITIYRHYNKVVYQIITVIDMNNKDKKIALSFNVYATAKYCTFNLKGEFILYSVVINCNTQEKNKIILIYSTQTKNNKWEYIQLYNFINHTGLFLLPSLFYYKPDKEIKYCWNNKYKNIDKPTDGPTDESTDDQTKFVFGIRNGRVWKSKFDEKISNTNFSSENSDELNKENNKIVECDEYLNVHSFNLYMDTVYTLFQKAIDDNSARDSTELAGNLIKWDICIENGKIKLKVFKKGKLINTKIENFHYPYRLLDSTRNNHVLVASSLFINDDIVILTTFGILIYTFSENNKSSEKDKSSDDNKSIFLNYFYFMKSNGYINMKILQHCKRIFSKSTLPLPNYDSFRLDGWASDIMNNKLSLLKYGVELLKFAIKEHKLELIDDIYKKCMTYFKDIFKHYHFRNAITR
ncbi:hypothetical protein RhiirA4_442840 [Rhizophagus irregularis]|uniref:Uncharacterized protein n=1 Tax=Rhizophagus irregularis TaxID=588596 RepID=A0A2I1GBC8_9GLOM|nr:hypothetical protein RhiirA4_442840 [Rhizophagus irregularis]